MNILIFIIKVYKDLISPFLPSSCKFYPSCSQYAIEAVKKYKFKGIILSIYRIIRCNPWSNGGYDPVP